MAYKRFILLLVCLILCRICYSQTKDIVLDEFFYYECSTVSDRHYNSWLLSGVSKKKIIKDFNYDSEDLFVKSFIRNTQNLDVYYWPSSHMLKSHKELFLIADFDSVNFSIKEIMQNAKAIEYKFHLNDSTKLYLSIYKIKGSFFTSQHFQWCSRNPHRTYYEQIPRKDNYYLYSLISSKGINLTRKETKHIKSNLNISKISQQPKAK